MPKNKRSKLVSLTKVKKKPKEWKNGIIEKIRDSVQNYQRIVVFKVHNMRTAKFQELRDQLRDSTKFLKTPRRLTQRALGKDEVSEISKNIHKLSELIEGNVGLMCTNLPAEEAVRILRNFRSEDYARVGETATADFFLSKGPLEGPNGGFQHTLEPRFRDLGLPTQLTRGTIELLRDCEVCKRGDVLDSNQANILRLFDQKFSHFTLTPQAVFDQANLTLLIDQGGDLNPKALMMEGQDWQPVVIRKKKPSGSEAKSNSTINQAFRTGQAQTVRKHNAGMNKMSTAGAGKSAVKLENETEELEHETVSSELKKTIQQARIAKKMTQAQLAQAINEKIQIVQDYESGRAIPNGQILNKLSRVLGISLSNKKQKAKKK